MPAPSLKEVALGGLLVGHAYKFSYQSSSAPKKSKSDGVVLELKPAEWKDVGDRLAASYPTRFAKNAAVRDRLEFVWATVRNSNAILEKIKAKKADASIRLWEDYWTANPEDHIHWDTAEAALKDCKRTMDEVNDAFTSDDRPDDDPRVSHFFRFFDVENAGGPEAYETEGIYLGESLDRRNGNVRHLWLTRKTTVSKKDHEKLFPPDDKE